MENNGDIFHKILVVGDPGTGKSSFIRRCVYDSFEKNYKTTIGVDFFAKTIKVDDETSVHLQFWDLAGQERFGSVNRIYFKNTSAAFVIFDVTRPNTIGTVKRWKCDIDSKVTISEPERSVPVILLANKIDLMTQEDDVQSWGKTPAEMDIFCKEQGFLCWFEISAKNNSNIEAAKSALMNVLLEKKEEQHGALDTIHFPPDIPQQSGYCG